MTISVTKATAVKPATQHPCVHCPWRAANQGKPHPGGWYTKANLQRLWAGMRRGGDMTCHPTDPAIPVPEGIRPAPEGATPLPESLVRALIEWVEGPATAQELADLTGLPTVRVQDLLRRPGSH